MPTASVATVATPAPIATMDVAFAKAVNVVATHLSAAITTAPCTPYAVAKPAGIAKTNTLQKALNAAQKGRFNFYRGIL